MINIIDKKSISGRKEVSLLDITQIDFICNIFIPYLETLEFRTKKYKDFLDFKLLAILNLQGKHLTDNGKELMKKLSNTMNDNRLTTNSTHKGLDNKTKFELDLLIKSDSLISVDSEGIAMIISENKYIRSTYIIKVYFLNGTVSYFTSGISCAKSLHVSNDTITKRLNDGKPVKNKEGLVVAQLLQRIKAYSSLIINF